MAAPTIKFKRGAQANLPALAAGGFAFVNDEFNLYLGLDGTSPNNKFLGSGSLLGQGNSNNWSRTQVILTH